MAKVWQFPDGTYLKNMVATTDPDQAAVISTTLIIDSQLKGGVIDYRKPLIMTGAEILADAVDEWSRKGGFNDENRSFSDYWKGALDKIKPDRKYKTDGEFSFFEEVTD